jgi:hypothetical protein
MQALVNVRREKYMKRHPLIPIALTLALAAACAPSTQLVTPNPVAPTLQSAPNTPQRLFPVKFSVVAPADFRTQQVAPTYARLQIDGASADATIVNGDTNGFIPITSDTTVVEAQVPTGENITVTLSTHMSNAEDSPAVATVGGVFHLNADGQLYDMEPVPNSTPLTYTEQVLADQSVRLDLPGEIMAMLVRQLREAAGTTTDPLAPIDIETYRSFATALISKSPLVGPEILAGVKIADIPQDPSVVMQDSE